jgi:hypothetical protein
MTDGLGGVGVHSRLGVNGPSAGHWWECVGGNQYSTRRKFENYDDLTDTLQMNCPKAEKKKVTMGDETGFAGPSTKR